MRTTVNIDDPILKELKSLQKKEGKPLVLQEMSWTDVRDYLKANDMVIIPLGSTEQHGPHMPLGTDYYEAMGFVV